MPDSSREADWRDLPTLGVRQERPAINKPALRPCAEETEFKMLIFTYCLKHHSITSHCGLGRSEEMAKSGSNEPH